jgi:hypothetical protein
LRSPAHLLVTVLVVGVIAVVVAVALPNAPQRGGSAATPPSQATLTPSQSSASSSTATTRLTAPLETPTSAPPAPEALQVAKAWATAWVNHPAGITSQQWVKGLAPYTTDEYLPVMNSVDPANVPASRVTGEPTAKVSYTSSAQVLVPTDGGELEISVIRTPAGWRVAGYNQAS